jgi:hypothetical protein
LPPKPNYKQNGNTLLACPPSAQLKGYCRRRNGFSFMCQPTKKTPAKKSHLPKPTKPNSPPKKTKKNTKLQSPQPALKRYGVGV